MKLVKANRVTVPPNPPWKPLVIREKSGGYLSYFYNDELSSIPIRGITIITAGGNKVDPNIETKTYGLFSYCNKKMRKSIVSQGCRYVFFITNRKGVRVLVGLYFVKWHTSISSNDDDFCLAADKIWFVKHPIPLVDVDKICDTNISRPFRTCLRVTPDECRKMASFLKRKPNATQLYLSEIDRLEKFNLRYTGYRYFSGKIKDSYSWNCDKIKSILKNASRRPSKNA